MSEDVGLYMYLIYVPAYWEALWVVERSHGRQGYVSLPMEIIPRGSSGRYQSL